MQHFPCGLTVDVLPFAAQPSGFWREALKELMHSLSMSMVRDKSVDNFVERLASFGAGARATARTDGGGSPTA